MRKQEVIFRQGANEVPIASMARWDAQLRMLVVLERQCLSLWEEVDHLSERQEFVADLEEKEEFAGVAST